MTNKTVLFLKESVPSLQDSSFSTNRWPLDVLTFLIYGLEYHNVDEYHTSATIMVAVRGILVCKIGRLLLKRKPFIMSIDHYVPKYQVRELVRFCCKGIGFLD